MEYTPAGRPSSFTLPELADPADLQAILSDFADDTLSAHGDTVTGNYDVTGSVTADSFIGLGATVVCTSGSRPGSPTTGQIIYETDTGLLMVWTSAVWAQASGSSSGGTGDFPTFFLMGA